jgi:hypothetical protein
MIFELPLKIFLKLLFVVINSSTRLLSNFVDPWHGISVCQCIDLSFPYQFPCHPTVQLILWRCRYLTMRSGGVSKSHIVCSNFISCFFKQSLCVTSPHQATKSNTCTFYLLQVQVPSVPRLCTVHCTSVGNSFCLPVSSCYQLVSKYHPCFLSDLPETLQLECRQLFCFRQVSVEKLDTRQYCDSKQPESSKNHLWVSKQFKLTTSSLCSNFWGCDMCHDECLLEGNWSVRSAEVAVQQDSFNFLLRHAHDSQILLLRYTCPFLSTPGNHLLLCRLQ